MVYVKVEKNESFDRALHRFMRICDKAGIMTEYRRHQFFEKPSTIRRRKRNLALRRTQRIQRLTK